MHVPEADLYAVRILPGSAGPQPLNFVSDFREGQGPRRLVTGGFTLELDSLRGVTVFDAVPPETLFPERRLAYYEIPGINRLEGRLDSLVVNNVDDLLTLDVTNPRVPQEQARARGGAGPFAPVPELPEGTAATFDGPARPNYFKCPDPTRGRLLGWRYESSDDLTCILTP